MGEHDEVIGAITDPTVRRFVRVVVHVRRFLPFYVTGALFAVTMAVVPAIDGGDGGSPAAVAAPGGGAGTAAGTASTGAAARRATAPVVVAAAPLLSSGGAFDVLASDGLLGDVVGEVAAPAAGAARGVQDVTGADPFATDVDAPDADVPDAPDPCRLEPPAPAPQVDPSREIGGGQDTAEALVRQEAPVDVAETAAPVTDAAVCSVPDAPVETPSVPLPATPVSYDGPLPGWFARWLLPFALLG